MHKDVPIKGFNMHANMEIEYYFSPSTGGFYNTDVHDTMPEDVVSITNAQREELLEKGSRGHDIKAGKDGHPEAVAREKYIPTYREKREVAFSEMDAEGGDTIDALIKAIVDGDTAEIELIAKARQKIKNRHPNV